MRFEELYQLALEAAKNFGSPKNIGGGRLNTTKEAEGPSGYVSSSVGKSDNFQERVPIDQKNKKGFDPKAAAKQRYSNLEIEDPDSGETIIRKKTEFERENVWSMLKNENKTLFNAFSLLNNDDFFKTRFAEYSTKYHKGFIAINLENEKKLKNLRFEISKNNGLIESLKDEISQYKQLLKNYYTSDEEKYDTSADLAAAQKSYDESVKNIKKIGGGAELMKLLQNLDTLIHQKNIKRKNISSKAAQLEIQKLNVEIEKIENKIEEISKDKPRLNNRLSNLINLNKSIEELSLKSSQQNLKPADIIGVEGKTLGAENVLKKIEDKLQKVYTKREKDMKDLESVENYTSNVTNHNEKLNRENIERFKNLVTNSATRILEDKFSDFDSNSADIEDVDWNSSLLNREEIYNMLVLLSSPDSEKNPIFRFIDKLNNQYMEFSPDMDISRGIMSHDVDRAMSDNEDITIMREFGKLPFSIITNYYKTVNISTLPINNEISTVSFRKAYKTFYDMCTKFSGYESSWDSGVIKLKLKNLLGIEAGGIFQQKSTTLNMGEALSERSKIDYEKIIDQEYKINARGVDSFKQLLSRVDADLRGKYPRKFEEIKRKIISNNTIKESFDELANMYASSFIFDQNDFLLDLQEVKQLTESKKKCTGPTKKASSDRKGKKWTKCAKQPDGSYKRIHWGQAGVRVTGKSGNTKRKKAFRARHKCSKAKQGSSQQAACSDW